jgi:hypothetical protein
VDNHAAIIHARLSINAFANRFFVTNVYLWPIDPGQTSQMFELPLQRVPICGVISVKAFSIGPWIPALEFNDSRFTPL